MNMYLLFTFLICSQFYIIKIGAMLAQGTSMVTNVVILTAQKPTVSRVCLGTLISPNRILTTYTCVQDAFQIIVQHNYNDDFSYTQLPLYVSASNIVHNEQTHHSKGYLHNVAIIKLDTSMAAGGFGIRDIFKLPRKNESPNHQLKKDITYTYMVYGNLFSDDYTMYPKLGYSIGFKLENSSVCRNIVKPSDYNSEYDISETIFHDKDQHCFSSRDEKHVICSEDEGAPIIAYVVRPDSIIFDFVIIGLVNINSHKCNKIKEDSSMSSKSLFINFVSLTSVVPWINDQL